MSNFLGQDEACFRIEAVQRLQESICLTDKSNEAFVRLVQKYYDPSLEDEHTKKGGTDLKFGFAGGGLPVVLHHNTPNNSLFLLWAEQGSPYSGLVPAD